MCGRLHSKTPKGYAWLRTIPVGNELPEEIFIHVSSFEGDWEALKKGDLLMFTKGLCKGKIQAFDAKLAVPEERKPEVDGNSANYQPNAGLSSLYDASNEFGGR